MWKKISLSFLTVFTINTPVLAGLTDYMRDSLNNLDENLALQSFKTQERGYLIGGSWHYRVPNMTIYPFTITTPSIKASCGAIDIIMGGFSYVNPEYLVQFLQNLIQAAPAVAFEIALDAFAPQVKQIVNDITALVNLINQLNFQSCQVLNGIKAYIENNILKNKESTLGKGAAEQQASGSNESFFASIKNWFNSFSSQFQQILEELEEKRIQSKNGEKVSINTSSIIEDALKATSIGSDSQFSQLAQLIRGILGDINPQKIIQVCQDGTGRPSGYIPPVVTQITEELLTKWLTNNVRLPGMDKNGNIVYISFDSIKNRIIQDIIQLQNDMLQGNRPSNRYLYLTYSDIPIVAYLKYATSTGDPDLSTLLNDKMADIITLDIVYATLKKVIKTVIRETKDLVQSYKQQYAKADCITNAITDDLKQLVNNYHNFMNKFTVVYWNIKKQRESQLVEFYRNYSQLTKTVFKRVNEIINPAF